MDGLKGGRGRSGVGLMGGGGWRMGSWSGMGRETRDGEEEGLEWAGERG